MGYFKDVAKNWLHKHPQLHAFYHATNRLGIISAPLHVLPDFVIVGAMKGGSTSLYNFVTQHPDIARAAQKEIGYFANKYKYGEKYYRSYFPTKLSAYLHKKQTHQKLLTGEASIAYLFFPAVPNRMKDLLPDIKLIIILRNPVDRAYSHYWLAKRLNNETFPFEKAVELEEERCAGEFERLLQDPYFIPTNFVNNSYLAGGIYADQLEHWFRCYNRNQFLFLSTEDFAKNPQQTLNQFFDFVGVRPLHAGNLKNLNVGNYEKMNESTRKFLVEYFKPHNKRLYKLLQRDFDWDV